MNFYKEQINSTIIYHHQYYDLKDFLMTIKNAKINRYIFNGELSSESLDSSFSNTNSFEEAWNMCRFTWNEGFDDFSNAIKKIQLRFENEYRIINKYKVVGGSPSVPRYLLGIPTSMHSREKILDKKVINIYLNVSYNSNTTVEQIKNRGILTLSLIEHLEKTGLYQINLHFIELSKNQNEIIYCDIPLKKDNEYLNIKKCYFPIVHASFLRRLCFRATEITPVRTDWSVGYGRAMKFDEARDILNNDFNNSIYISSPIEMGIKGIDINEDAETFIRIINTKYADVLEQKNEERKHGK